jgi:hypothetical protein
MHLMPCKIQSSGQLGFEFASQGFPCVVTDRLIPVFEGAKGGTTVNVPGPSAAEQAAQAAQASVMQQQLAIMQQQQQESRVLGQLQYEQQGYTPTYNEKGVLTGLTQSDQMKQQRAMQDQITGEYQKRSLAALHGELPVDPGLMIDLQRQERAQQQTLAQQFGQGGQGSTGAMQASDMFAARKNAILEGARRGDLTLSEQLGASSQMQQTALMQRGLQGSMVAPNLQSMMLQNYGAPAQTAGTIAGQGLQNRQMGLQANMFNAQNKSSTLGGLIGAAGGVMGGMMGGAGYAGGFSKLFS